jgi:hypothetical protein
MTSFVAAVLEPADACPSPECHPGDNPACLPLASMDLAGGTIAAYLCDSCGTAWAAWFDVYWWVVERSVIPAVRDTGRRAA